MAMLDKKIGSKIAQIRLEQSLTQAQLAEKMALSVESISRMERGVTFPSLRTIEKISESLNTPMYKFFVFNNEMEWQGEGFNREISKLIAILKDLDKNEIILLRKILKEIKIWRGKK